MKVSPPKRDVMLVSVAALTSLLLSSSAAQSTVTVVVEMG